MIRPPPLQLKLDNRLPPPRTPSPPTSHSFVAQLFKANWKNPVIAVAGLNGLRFAYACHNAFVDARVDDAEAATSLAKVSIALAVMYLVALIIEIYGIIGVSLQRLSLLRAYLYLALFSAVLVSAAALLRGISYFTLAEELVYECIDLALDGRAAEKSTFRGYLWPSSIYGVSHTIARKQCVAAWVHNSWTQVAAVFLFGVIPAAAHAMLVVAYARQAGSTTHAASLVRRGNTTAGPRARGGARRGAYARLAATEATTTVTPTTQGAPVRRRPAASSSTASMRTTDLTRGGLLVAGTKRHSVSPERGTYLSLQRAHRPPPLTRSPPPVLGLAQTPAPPGYEYRPSRVYAAFAAPAARAGAAPDVPPGGW